MMCIESGPMRKVRHNLVRVGSILHDCKKREIMCTGSGVRVGSLRVCEYKLYVWDLEQRDKCEIIWCA